MSIKGVVYFTYELVKNFIYPVHYSPVPVPNNNSIYEYQFRDDRGEEIDLSAFKGKKLLIVNTASECRYTRQYSGLEELYLKYSDKLTVVAFPCNDFGKQEQGSNKEIQGFCQKNYGVTFPVFRKTNVKVTGENDIFEWLCNSQKNGWNNQKPLWNFWKFLIDENGKLIAVFPSRYKPLGKELVLLVSGN